MKKRASERLHDQIARPILHVSRTMRDGDAVPAAIVLWAAEDGHRVGQIGARIERVLAWRRRASEGAKEHVQWMPKRVESCRVAGGVRECRHSTTDSMTARIPSCSGASSVSACTRANS